MDDQNGEIKESVGDSPKQTTFGRPMLFGAVSLAAAVLIFAWLMRSSPCDDDLRGYEDSLSADLSYIKQTASDISSRAKLSKSRKLQQIIDFEPSDYAALRLCISECRLLEACMRFRPWSGPATGCPEEYKNFRSRVDDVLALLGNMKEARASIAAQVKLTNRVEELESQLEEAKASSGATGNQATIIRGQLNEERRNLANNLEQTLGVVLPTDS